MLAVSGPSFAVSVSTLTVPTPMFAVPGLMFAVSAPMFAVSAPMFAVLGLMFAVSGPMFAVSGPMLLEAECADSVQTVELVEYAAPNCEYMETDESCLERTLEISRDLWPYVMLLRVQQTIVCHSKCCCASCKLLLPIRTAAAHVANFCSTLTFHPQLAATFSENIWPFALFSAAEPF